MFVRGLKTAAACFLLGVFCFTLLPWLWAYSRLDHWVREPYFSCPVPVPSEGIKIRSDRYGKGHFGASRGNKGQRRHLGIDLLAPVGRPVFASQSGRVYLAGFDKGYGNYVELAHPEGFSTRYAHLSEVLVKTGDWVPQGMLLGRSGKTGNANSKLIKAHLHFEIRYARIPLDPRQWMGGLAPQ